MGEWPRNWRGFYLPDLRLNGLFPYRLWRNFIQIHHYEIGRSDMPEHCRAYCRQGKEEGEMDGERQREAWGHPQ
jgi:hypothetical protein